MGTTNDVKQVSVSDIKSAAQAASGAVSDIESRLNCALISGLLEDELEGNLGVFVGRAETDVCGENHAFNYIPAAHVTGETTPVIIDASLDQFCEENEEAGEIAASIAPRSQFKQVHVLTRRHTWYNRYYQGWKSHTAPRDVEVHPL